MNLLISYPNNMIFRKKTVQLIVTNKHNIISHFSHQKFIPDYPLSETWAEF